MFLSLGRLVKLRDLFLRLLQGFVTEVKGIAVSLRLFIFIKMFFARENQRSLSLPLPRVFKFSSSDPKHDGIVFIYFPYLAVIVRVFLFFPRILLPELFHLDNPILTFTH